MRPVILALALLSLAACVRTYTNPQPAATTTIVAPPSTTPATIVTTPPPPPPVVVRPAY
jgi:hypothetical protein